MASLQYSLLSLQYKILLSCRLSPSLSSHNPLNLFFSSSLPSIRLSFATLSHRFSSNVTKSSSTLNATVADVEKIKKLFSNPSIFNFFAKSTVDLQKKRQVINEIVLDFELQAHTTNFLNILVEAKRIDLVKEIVKEFKTGLRSGKVDKLQFGRLC